jgi:hypothetical protein
MSRVVIHRNLAEAIDSLSSGLETCTRPEDRKLIQDYLAALAQVLARATLGEDVLSRLDGVERLFGNTWLVDETPFRDGLAKWRQFRSEYERVALGAMTINERLHAMGLLESYDRARAEGDSDAVSALLRRVYVDEVSIAKIVGSRSAG